MPLNQFKTVSTPVERREILIAAWQSTGLNAASFGKLMNGGKADGDAVLYKKTISTSEASSKGTTYVDVMCAELLRFLYQSGINIQSIEFDSVGRIIGVGEKSSGSYTQCTISTPEQRREILIAARTATGLSASVFGRLLNNGKADGDAILYKKEKPPEHACAKGTTYVDVMCAELLRLLNDYSFDIGAMTFSSNGIIQGCPKLLK
ncbi:hypothetical protein OCF84_21780 (plasmid) [Shewanella xiamenensis]|uniref:Uncharacterized protein n=1 Tax=Shewanella xiamenensis TaxID=332186 RepID=A0ABT6UDE3_9GAMM|nr:hypothetical protein [Shewanella xiamenensis]MDI5832490.1 hypothetical protein [Shewanella xiamenensis]WHF57891.1 hypothetical protein OCF84_21780 [Shewanella xiamenensis]